MLFRSVVIVLANVVFVSVVVYGLMAVLVKLIIVVEIVYMVVIVMMALAAGVIFSLKKNIVITSPRADNEASKTLQ